ncbi:hypothetical protein K2173_023403 [Erythroxylum novogranatense]|uniref:Uncharacterized protein n=1 Tax=Erythroxylum novogranatense TaxID=1862640 RepID=A0AAV8TZG8_9ROSI|nr:hypothetical protein K2173_023403 [Erythroxylum novogranatense]
MSQQGRQLRQKLEVYSEVLRRLEESKNPEANCPGFEDQIWAHFYTSCSVHPLSEGNPTDSVSSDSPDSKVNRSTKHKVWY